DMNLDRRTFLKTAAAGAAVLAPAARAEASGVTHDLDAARVGVLVDTTKCVGCRACEAACAETNSLPDPSGDERVFASPRDTDTRTYTVVNAAATAAPDATARYIKRQCMHCVEPACASACLVRALDKTPSGPVVYHKNLCLGCRYCMVACPFEVPKYEYDSALPFVQKCTFCADRQAKGEDPACTSVCPTGALQFGKRTELIEIAKERLYAPGSTYVRHVYGEHEVGGTSWMYITDIPLDTLGLPTGLGTVAYSSLTQASLAAVPFVLTLWPPLLMGIYTFSKRRNQLAQAPSLGQGGHHA
ncbi:MAG: 4Fe-4S dicluster domain-containing protein, partial [Vicinamibacterales bacterium]|nr:4Fe-4S dicluster domain-containing protein [Vicinamibacterales bacterium]